MIQRIAWPSRLVLLSLALGVLGMVAGVSHAAASSAKKKAHSTRTAAKSTSAKSSSSTKSSVAAKAPATQKTKGSSSSSAKNAKGKAGKSVASRRDRGQKAPTPERVSEIQTALAKNGAYSGTPNGKWDDATVDAMKTFQSGHGLNATGKLDARTLQQLGLGSQTAGIAAPVPSDKSSANLSSRNAVVSRP